MKLLKIYLAACLLTVIVGACAVKRTKSSPATRMVQPKIKMEHHQSKPHAKTSVASILSDTNAIYHEKARAYAQILESEPETIKTDSIIPSPLFMGTTNFTMRKPNFVIIHHTSQNSCAETIRTFRIPRTEVSAHYVICKDGMVYHMLNDYLRGHHAGLGKWGSVIDMNSCSIGIELDNDGFEPFAHPQIDALLSLLAILKEKYNIPTNNFIGHADFAPRRKNDPSVHFPWRLLAEKGFGQWYDDIKTLPEPPFPSYLQDLKIIGYDIKDTTAAFRAFKRHFLRVESGELTDLDKKVLYNLSSKY